MKLKTNNAMSKIVVLIIVLVIFCIVTAVVWFGGRGKKPADTLSVKLDKNSSIRIYQNEDKSIQVDYCSYEDRPRAVELFPEMIPDLSNQDDILDQDFWEKMTHFHELPLEERNKMRDMLVAHGFVKYADAHRFEMDPPKDENGNSITLPPDPADDESYQKFWDKPFIA